MLFSEYSILEKIDVLGAECVGPPFLNCKNPFWNDVFKAYREYTNCKVPESEVDFLSEPLHCNNNILVNQKPFYSKNWFKKGVVHIFDIIKENGMYLRYNEFREKFPHVRSNYLEYYGVLGAVKKFQNKYKISFNEHISQETIIDTHVWSILINVEKRSKQIYKALIYNCEKPSCILKWNIQFQDLHWKTIFNNVYKTTRDTKLQWFQFRIVHRILVTNYTLKKMKIRDNDNCTFCNAFPETTEHLLYYCVHVNRFWELLRNWIISKCKHLERLQDFHLQLIIFGTQKDFKSDSVFDLILQMAKYYIYRCKCLDKPVLFDIFKKELGKRYGIEKIIFSNLCQWQKFVTKWACYTDLINSIEEN